jgi:hypothetical protein
VRPLLQAAHMKLSHFSGEGISAGFIFEMLYAMPTSEHYHNAFFGNPEQRLAGLSRLGVFIGSAAIDTTLASWCLWPPTSPVAHLCLRRLCDRILGEQPNAREAARQALRCLARVHEDKTRHIRFTEPIQPKVCVDLTLMLTDLRAILNHPRAGDQIYSEGRLRYGQQTKRQLALPAALTGAALVVGFFLPVIFLVCLVLWATYQAVFAPNFAGRFRDKM